jgi:hypothetical protein
VREDRTVGAHEAHDHRRAAAAAEQFAVERIEVAGPQRHRDHPGKRAVSGAPLHAHVEHLFAGHVPGHHLRHVFEILAVANADEVVALADRKYRRRVIAAAGEQVPVVPEDRHGGHLRIAAAHRAQLVVNLGFARADAVVVQAFGQIDDARVERHVHVEHLQRVLFRDPHRAQRHVGGIGLACAQIGEGHGRDIHARQHDRRGQQRDQRDAPHVEILLRHSGKRRLVRLSTRAAGMAGTAKKATRARRVGPVWCHFR